jgi:hypothetical protein
MPKRPGRYRVEVFAAGKEPRAVEVEANASESARRAALRTLGLRMREGDIVCATSYIGPIVPVVTS